MKYSTTYSGREAFSSWRRLKKSSQCLATSSLLYNTYTTVSQIYYQDQGVQDQDQTKTRQAETKIKTSKKCSWLVLRPRPGLETQIPVSQLFHNCFMHHKHIVLMNHDAAPRYLADLCVPAHSVHGRQQLHSTASGTLLVPHARTATGQHSFAINGPRTWNSLPADLRTPDTTLCSFKRHLKAHLFQQ